VARAGAISGQEAWSAERLGGTVRDMIFPTVTEITPRPEPVTPDPFIAAPRRPATAAR
jgi:hypothetical protein